MKKLLLVFVILFFAFAIYAVSVFFASDDIEKNSVTIKFSSWGSESEIKIIKTLIQEFEQQNPDIKIEFVHIPQNYFQKLHLLFASNLAPDVVFLNNYYAPKYVKAGLLEDLTDYVKKENFFEKSLTGFTFDDKLYAVPRDVSELVVYYNKDLFKKNNLSFPAQNWTINDYKVLAKKLSKDTNGDGINEIWGTSFESEALFWLPFLMSNGTGILSENGQKLLIESKEALEIIQEYVDMANKDNIAPAKAQSSSLTMAQLFLQGKIAMHVSGRWLVPKYREQAQFDWDVAQFPSGKSGSVMNIDASGYAVSKSSKHKEQAIKFVGFMTSKASLDKLSQSGLVVPALKASAYSNAFLTPDKKPKNAIAFLKTVETGKSTPVNEDYQKLTDELNRILEPVFLGKKKAENLVFPPF